MEVSVTDDNINLDQIKALYWQLETEPLQKKNSRKRRTILTKTRNISFDPIHIATPRGKLRQT